MKKILLTSALLGAVAATSASASTLIGVKIGGDYLHISPSGTFAPDGLSQQDFDYKSSSQGSIWAAFEHPVPFLPNIKIRENFLSGDGKSTLASDWNFGGSTISSGAVTTTTDLSNTDFILYYELLDNDLVSLDLGASYKNMQGSYKVSDGTTSVKKKLHNGIAMAYANAEGSVPGIGLYGFAEVMLGLNETSVYDYSVGLGWSFDQVEVIDTKLRVGYREFKFDVNNFNGITANSKFSGLFAGFEVVF